MGRLFCCHGNGQAQYEKIITCRHCQTSWHTGCVTKYVMTSEPRESVLMDNEGNLHRKAIPDPFACCKELEEQATVRSESSRSRRGSGQAAL